MSSPSAKLKLALTPKTSSLTQSKVALTLIHAPSIAPPRGDNKVALPGVIAVGMLPRSTLPPGSTRRRPTRPLDHSPPGEDPGQVWPCWPSPPPLPLPPNALPVPRAATHGHRPPHPGDHPHGTRRPNPRPGCAPRGQRREPRWLPSDCSLYPQPCGLFPHRQFVLLEGRPVAGVGVRRDWAAERHTCHAREVAALAVIPRHLPL